MKELIKKIGNLERALQKSGKSETASFYAELSKSIQAESDANQLRLMLQQIRSSGRIVQYANFNVEEERLWEDLYCEAIKLLQSEEE